MITALVGATATVSYVYLDLTDTPKTGMTSPADVTLTLYRETSGVFAAAGESVTWGEIGSTGYYYAYFTPQYSGQYVLWMKEENADSYGRRVKTEFDILAAGASFSPAYANAYCAETDIERYLNRAISGTTSPDDTAAAGWAEERAAVLSTLLTAWGYSITPSTVIADSRLEDLLRAANAIGAAMDYVLAQEEGKSPALSEKGSRLEGLWNTYTQPGPGDATRTAGYLWVEVKGNLACLTSDYIQSGDTDAYDEGTAPTNEPIGISMADEF